ncbi:MFS transporter [Phaeocystidibacter luteus]|nr:MFS transporter [Phaeocystidibacter luteus]
MANQAPIVDNPSSVKKPALSLKQMINLSMGFLGIQMGFGLQNGNASRILTDFGADVHDLGLFWLVAPFTGLIVQPIIGHLGDNTWGRMGRRKPYFLIGAIFAALGLIFLPNSNILAGESMKAMEFMGLSAILWMGVIFLAMMDASFNVSMEPFRALVGDMLPKRQGALGFSVQTILISIGAILGSFLPTLLTYVGVSNEPIAGSVAPNVVWSFYVGAAILMITILYTIVTIKEYPPEEFAKFQGEKIEKREKNMFSAIFHDTMKMPRRMQRLSWVQFFSWFGLFTMWAFTTPSIAQNNYDTNISEVEYNRVLAEIDKMDELGMVSEEDREDFEKMRSSLLETSPKDGMYFIQNKPATMLSQNMILNDRDLFASLSELRTAQPNLFTQEMTEEFKKAEGKLNDEEFVLNSSLSTFLAEHSNDADISFVARLKAVAKNHQKAGDMTGLLFTIYNFVALIFAFLLNTLAKRTSRKFVHFFALLLGGLGLISMMLIKDPGLLWISMVGIGVAWASILAMPYALLIDSLPLNKMGIYMGIFNFFIVIPQIINGLMSGAVIQDIFGNYSIYYVALGGALMLLASLLTLRIREPLFRSPSEPETAAAV